jgi:hypothetical protein
VSIDIAVIRCFIGHCTHPYTLAGSDTLLLRSHMSLDNCRVRRLPTHTTAPFNCEREKQTSSKQRLPNNIEIIVLA